MRSRCTSMRTARTSTQGRAWRCTSTSRRCTMQAVRAGPRGVRAGPRGARHNMTWRTCAPPLRKPWGWRRRDIMAGGKRTCCAPPRTACGESVWYSIEADDPKALCALNRMPQWEYNRLVCERPRWHTGRVSAGPTPSTARQRPCDAWHLLVWLAATASRGPPGTPPTRRGSACARCSSGAHGAQLLVVWADSDWAGYQEARRNASGGVLCA